MNLENNVTSEPRVLRFGEAERTFEECDNRPQLIANHAEELIQRLWDAYRASGATVLSLDVFDTFLIRNNKPEARRWYEVSAQVAELISAAPWDVYVARNLATVLSYRTRAAVEGCREGHIEDILKVQKRLISANQLTTEALKQIEINYEIQNLAPNHLFLDLCGLVQSVGGRVILISDMYLDAASISKIIRGVCGTKVPVDDIISSADTVISKRSGRVFEHIEAKMSAEPRDFFHIGDSRIGDFVMPTRRGWSAIHLPVPAAERQRRDNELTDFLEEMNAKGHDASAWAKV